MSKSIWELLLGALEDLRSEQFKKFTNKLTDFRSEPRVRRGEVEDKDRVDIAMLLRDKFTEKRALKITLEILRAIDANQTAEDLEKDAAAAGFSPSAGEGGSSGAPTLTKGGSTRSTCVETPTNDVSNKATFIDDNWVELVQRATGVEAILDILLSKKVINDWQYSEINSEKIPQRKMRVLIHEALRACGALGKAIFYDVLMDLEPYMMKDLGAS